MRTFRTLLAIIFSLLIVAGIWKYYTSNDQVSIKDPFVAVWSKFATYTTEPTTKKTVDTKNTPNTHAQIGKEVGELHKDFSFGTIDAEHLDRLIRLGVVGGNPNGHILWLNYCDYNAKYCQKSFDKGIVYDYLEAYPQELQYIFKPFPTGKNASKILPHHATMCAMDLGTSKQYFAYYNGLYTDEKIREDMDSLIVLGRELGIEGFDTCMENSNYELVLQQETKLAKNTFSLTSLPANIFINKTTGARVLVPGYYDTEEVLPAIAAIQ